MRAGTYKGSLSSGLQLVHQTPPKTSVWWGDRHGRTPHKMYSVHSKTRRGHSVAGADKQTAE